MRRLLTAIAFALSLAGAEGCSLCGWQANSSSQAVDIDPFAVGSGHDVVTPTNNPTFVDGEPLDMRSKH